jgi:hypothetical protein
MNSNFKISFILGFLLLSILSIIIILKIYTKIKEFYNKLWNGQNNVIILLCEKKKFGIISFLFFLNDLIMLVILIFALFILKGYYDVISIIYPIFVNDWFSASILFLLSSVGAFMASIFILASTKFQIKNSHLLVYLKNKLMSTKNQKDFNDFVTQFSQKLVYLSNNYREHVENYYSLRFTESYIKHFFFLPSLKLEMKKDLIINYIYISDDTYVDLITALNNVDKIIRSKCKNEYDLLIEYLKSVYEFNDKSLFNMLRSLSITNFDKIKKFILTHDEILVFLFKITLAVILIILAFKFSDIGEKLIEIVKIFN